MCLNTNNGLPRLAPNTSCPRTCPNTCLSTCLKHMFGATGVDEIVPGLGSANSMISTIAIMSLYFSTMYIHTRAHARTHARTHARARAHTHTHTRSLFSSPSPWCLAMETVCPTGIAHGGHVRCCILRRENCIDCSLCGHNHSCVCLWGIPPAPPSPT